MTFVNAAASSSRSARSKSRAYLVAWFDALASERQTPNMIDQLSNDFGLEARYEKRPTLWIEPKGTWGPGYVELIEIPTTVEIHDNIATDEKDLFWIEGTTRRWDGYAHFQREPDRILEWFDRYL